MPSPPTPHLRAWSCLVACLALCGCATMTGAGSAQRAAMNSPTKAFQLGKTTQDEVFAALGKADETLVDEKGRAIWIYNDIVDVPLLVSLIPVLGDAADIVAMTHTNRELIVQYDERCVVRKFKVRKLD